MASIQIPDEKATPEELLAYISSMNSWQSLMSLQQMCLDSSRKTTEELRQITREDISELELRRLLEPRQKDRNFRNKTIHQVLEEAKVIKSSLETQTPTFIEVDKTEWNVCVHFYKSDGSCHGPSVVSRKDGAFSSDPLFSWMEEICMFIVWHHPFVGLELLFPTSVFFDPPLPFRSYFLMKIFSGKLYKRASPRITLPFQPDHHVVKNFLSIMEAEAGGDPTVPCYPTVAEEYMVIKKE